MSVNLILFYKLTLKPWRARTKGWWGRTKDDWAMRIARKLLHLDTVDMPAIPASLRAAYAKPGETILAKQQFQEGPLSSIINRQKRRLCVNAKTIENLNIYKTAFDMTNGLNERKELALGEFRRVIKGLVDDPIGFLANNPDLMIGSGFIRRTNGEEEVSAPEPETEKEQRHKMVNKKISKAAVLVNKSAEIKPFIPEEETNES